MHDVIASEQFLEKRVKTCFGRLSSIDNIRVVARGISPELQHVVIQSKPNFPH
jgi:hypothetical protein